MVDEKQRIAVICIHSCPLGTLGGRDTGGMNVYIVEMARELEKRGYIVDIFTRSHYPEHSKVLSIGENIRLIHIDTGACEEVPKVVFYSYLQKFICGIEGYRSSNDIHYCMIHSHYWLSGLVGKELQALWHIPHITMFHTLGIVKNITGIGEEETELRIESERELASQCDCIIAATEREKTDLIRYCNTPKDRITIIPCGFNPYLFRPVDRHEARNTLGLNNGKIILFVGRIDPLKGLGNMIQAMTRLDNTLSPELVIVGGDEYSREEFRSLQALAAELGIQEKVVFRGSVEQDKLPLFYSAADVCVIPSYYESFGLVALESLACGTPVVATDVGDMKNVLKDRISGSVIENNTPDVLARAVSENLCAQEKGDAITFRRASIMKYSWSTIADNMVREYERLHAAGTAICG
jgi:D-inositol-3-phosphate glycosyltransferase